MLDIFRGLQGLIKPHRVTIDSSIFRLHYSATTTFLLVFSIITTTRQYVGNPIGGEIKFKANIKSEIDNGNDTHALDIPSSVSVDFFGK